METETQNIHKQQWPFWFLKVLNFGKKLLSGKLQRLLKVSKYKTLPNTHVQGPDTQSQSGKSGRPLKMSETPTLEVGHAYWVERVVEIVTGTYMNLLTQTNH